MIDTRKKRMQLWTGFVLFVLDCIGGLVVLVSWLTEPPDFQTLVTAGSLFTGVLLLAAWLMYSGAKKHLG